MDKTDWDKECPYTIGYTRKEPCDHYEECEDCWKELLEELERKHKAGNKYYMTDPRGNITWHKSFPIGLDVGGNIVYSIPNGIELIKRERLAERENAGKGSQ